MPGPGVRRGQRGELGILLSAAGADSDEWGGSGCRARPCGTVPLPGAGLLAQACVLQPVASPQVSWQGSVRMLFRSWLQRTRELLGAAKEGRKPPRVRLAVESLENRTLLSGAPDFGIGRVALGVPGFPPADAQRGYPLPPAVGPSLRGTVGADPTPVLVLLTSPGATPPATGLAPGVPVSPPNVVVVGPTPTGASAPAPSSLPLPVAPAPPAALVRLPTAGHTGRVAAPHHGHPKHAPPAHHPVHRTHPARNLT
jgi:hypothetical protein